jgi:hypothetical protein
MKTLSISLFLVLLSFTQIYFIAAQPTLQITKVTPIDINGNTNFYLNRGFASGAIVELDAQNSGKYILTASLTDCSNVPAGFTTKNMDLSPGLNRVTIYFDVTKYAYIGIGNLHVSVLNPDNSPVTSMDLTVAIQILGDFDRNGVVSANDVAFLITAYYSYCATNSIAPQYRTCDINDDNKIDSIDVATFVHAYTLSWT